MSLLGRTVLYITPGHDEPEGEWFLFEAAAELAAIVTAVRHDGALSLLVLRSVGCPVQLHGVRCAAEALPGECRPLA